jgi:hypothetical protein
MMRALILATTAILLSCAPGDAQMSTPGIGTTSPLGISPASPLGMIPGASAGSAGIPIGVPLGATELVTPGISPGPISGAIPSLPGTTCSSTGMGNAVTGVTSTSTGLFSPGGVGTDATQFQSSSLNSTSSATCTQTTGIGATASPIPSTAGAGGTLGVPAIPLGSTGLGNAGLSPAPCPATGYTASATSGMASGSC